MQIIPYTNCNMTIKASFYKRPVKVPFDKTRFDPSAAMENLVIGAGSDAFDVRQSSENIKNGQDEDLNVV